MSPQNLGFLHLVPFERDNPRQGFADALELFAFAEELGFDSGWLRTRHMQYGVPSPAVMFGALSQVTSRMQLGNAVIPVGFENPFRLAEDLATADVLTGGRVVPGLSVHPPAYDDELNDLVNGPGWREQDFSKGRLLKLRSFLRGDALRTIPEYQGYGGNIDSERVEPHSPGLADRLWYGGSTLSSAQWAGENGFGFLVSNISRAEEGREVFDATQRAQIDRYREAARTWAAGSAATDAAEAAGGNAGTGTSAGAGAAAAGRATVARVAVPTDGTTPAQLEKYRSYVEARTPRTLKPLPSGTIIAQDIFGSTDEIVDRITNDRAFQAADDYIFELPFEMELADWKQMLEQFATRIGPALGWKPKN